MMYRINPDPTEMNPTTGKPIERSPTGALNMPSAPPSPGNIATVGAPLSSKATNPGGGGAVSTPPEQGQGFDFAKDRGTPVQVLSQLVQTDPEGGLSAAQQSMNVAKRTVENDDDNAEQLKELNKAIPDAKKSIKQLEKMVYDSLTVANTTGKINNKQHKGLKNRWKNIFNYISEDEMGLFLIDFGLRAMMAGETMGNLGALGAAGSGALGALQGRRAAGVEDERARRETARTSALDQYKAESDRMTAQGSLMRGEAAREQANRLDRGYTGQQYWQLELAKKVAESQGRDPADAEAEMLAIFQGVETPEARRQYWEKHFADIVAAAKKDPSLMKGVNVDEYGKKYSEYTPRDILDAADRMVDPERGALPGNKTADDFYEETE